MNLFQSIKEAVRQLLGKQEIAALGAKESGPMYEAVREWDNLFWRSELPDGSLGMAVQVTAYLATLATNEITLSAGGGQRADWINAQVLEHLQPVLHQAVQTAAQGGMAAVKPYLMGSNVYAEVIPRSRIFPRRWGPMGRIDAGFFTDFDRLESGARVCRVEEFELTAQGLRITNRAYRLRDGDQLGGQIELSAVERWAALAPEGQIAGVDRPHFGLLRMPMVNNIDPSPAPVSFYAQAVESIRQIDDTLAQLFWERDTGKRRMIVDRTAAVKDPVNGKPAIPFRQLASDYYLTLDMPQDGPPWGDYTPSLRVEEYRKLLETQLRLLEMQLGLSPGTFALDTPSGRVTATQVISEDRTTYNTVQAVQTRGLAAGLRDVLYWYDAFASLYTLAPAGAFQPSVSFGDSIFEDTGTEFVRRKALADAGYIRPSLLLAWYFGTDEDTAAAMLPPDAAGAPLSF